MAKSIMPASKVERTVSSTSVQVKPATPKPKGQKTESVMRIPSLRLVMPPGRIERTVPRQIVEPKPKVKAPPSESAKRIGLGSRLTQSPVDAWLAAGVLPINLDPTSIATCASTIKTFRRARQRRYRAWLRANVAFWYDVAIAIFDDPAIFAAIKDAPFIREARIGKIVGGKPAKEPPPLRKEDLCRVMLQVGFDKHAASAYYRRIRPLWVEKVDARDVLALLRENGLRDKMRQARHQNEPKDDSEGTTPASGNLRPLIQFPTPPSLSPSSRAKPSVKVTMSGVLSGTVTIAESDLLESTFVVVSTVTKTKSGALRATSVLR